jgi:hypothetical protein
MGVHVSECHMLVSLVSAANRQRCFARSAPGPGSSVGTLVRNYPDSTSSHMVRCHSFVSEAGWLADFHHRFASTTICPPCGEW